MFTVKLSAQPGGCGGDLGVGVVQVRSGDDQHGAVLGHLGLLDERDGARLVVVLFERFPQDRESVALGVVYGPLARTAHDTGGAVAGLQRADESAGDLFFRDGLGLLALGAGLDKNRSQGAHAHGAGQLGALFEIDVDDLQVRGKGGVPVEQIAGAAELGGPVEVSNGDVGLETLRHLGGLVGEAVDLVLGRIVGRIVLVGQIVDRHQHGGDHENIERKVAAVLGLSCFEPA